MSNFTGLLHLSLGNRFGQYLYPSYINFENVGQYLPMGKHSFILASFDKN